MAIILMSHGARHGVIGFICGPWGLFARFATQRPRDSVVAVGLVGLAEVGEEPPRLAALGGGIILSLSY